ncbi:MAG: DUF5686 family protein [Chitinophagaceae bacterium]
MNGNKKIFWLIIIFLLPIITTSAQKTVQGIVVDRQSDEPIPFASVFFKAGKKGMLTDSSGKFFFDAAQYSTNDTLEINSIGYKIVDVPVSVFRDSTFLTIKIEVQQQMGVVVKSKYNRALWFWHRIMQNKYKHDKTYWNNFSYEIYNKLELDIDNINTGKLGKNTFVKPLNFVFNYIDSSSESKPFLPVYLTETLSDYYLQHNPYRTREVIKATKTNGLDNESMIKQLGGTYQNVNIYANFIPVFDKQFVSPFNENGDNYYNFKLLDTQYLNKRRLVHLSFTPKHKGENTFNGDCWVNDTTFAVQKITLRPSGDANINFITGLSLIQEFRLINDTTWFLYKDKFVADISPIGKSNLSFKGRKTTTYEHVVVNNASVLAELAKSKKPEDIVLLRNAENKPDSFWATNRHEPLNKNEKTVYEVLDTLEKNSTYVHYRNTLNFLTTGVKDIGNIRIGPWYYWLSGNSWEGTRTRFDLSTNTDFSKHWYLHGYLAYGFLDKQFKGNAEIKYQFKKEPWSYVTLWYKNDLDNGQQYYDQIGTDNVFAVAFRRPNIPYKFQKIEQTNLEYYKETNNGFGFGFKASSKQFDPLQNLPGKQFYGNATGTALKTFETALRIRFAYSERTFMENFDRYSLGSDYPIVELTYTKGWPEVLNSSYDYHKIDFTISDYVKLAPYGSLYYNVFAGKVFGTLPYQLLEIHPGNEMFYYNKYAFNLMNRFEYISDKFAGFNVEHNIGNGLFRFIPLTRKLKFRQFYTVKGVIGNLSDANKQLNFVGNYPFRSLDGKWYMEVGTGVDNIFKFFRIDFVWRVAAPQTQPEQEVRDFGIFGSFRLSF